MQSERRHDLADNDLAGATFDVVDRIRPHLRTVAVAIGLLFAGLAIWTLVSAQQAAGQARSWEECIAALSAGDGERLARVVRQYPDSAAAIWARIMLADSALTQGCDLMFVDRGRGSERLKEAIDGYRRVLDGRPTGLAAERAVFGLAKANEALGDLEEARRGYEALVADHPDGAAAGLAKARVADLSREATRQWYAWFAAQPPAPRDSPAGGGSAAAEKPDAPPADATPPATAAPAKPSTGP